MKVTRIAAAVAATALGLGSALVAVTPAQAASFGPAESLLKCSVHFGGLDSPAFTPTIWTDDFTLAVDPEAPGDSGTVSVTFTAADGFLNGPVPIGAGTQTVSGVAVLGGAQSGTVNLGGAGSYPPADVGVEELFGGFTLTGSFDATSADLTTITIRQLTFLSALGDTYCTGVDSANPKTTPIDSGIVASINGDTTPPTVTAPPTTSAPATTAPATTEPTPTGQATGEPVTDSATLNNVKCGVTPGAGAAPDEYTGWDAVLTMKPGQAESGDTVEATVELTGSPRNTGPVAIEPGSVRFEAVVVLTDPDQGDRRVTLTGPLNKHTAAAGYGKPVAEQETVFRTDEYPLTATTKFVVGGGVWDAKIETFIFNSMSDPSNSNDFDVKCNRGASPWESPVAFNQPTVQVDVSGAVIPIDDETDDPDTTETTTDGSDELAETGTNETVVIALAALLVLQLGLILTVRAVRARPRGLHL